ncbi:DUF1467 family protein [Alterisphingorhabdus coralli]|uniref:DUF1467 family protein n=1 Tax=Alterisphingorhabdus coralli TaxID=3071408 RepID=A0AA97I094_9SPHN|nr:DUF1467 family protein [Parasphingorhabdus sp. SCSIO 66989]WOE73935.1 DUF1467 family protein [Parasphingorhabdus sp. SCSIO 66989]
MEWTSIIAIYLLFWVMAFMVVLPFGIKTHDELGMAKIPGQADSAPGNFRPGLVAIRATIVSAIAFGLFYLNYTNGWITTEDVDLFACAPSVTMGERTLLLLY